MSGKLKIENESKVVLKNGVPKLSCNDEIISTDCYLTYIDEEGDYDNFHKANFNLYSVSIPFHNRSINENTHLKSFFNGCLEENSLHVIDYKINKIIRNNKNAYIFPRLNVEVSERWEEESDVLTATLYTGAEVTFNINEGQLELTSDLFTL